MLERVTVIEDDFRSVTLPTSGRTLFFGNPPHVRHHDIGAPGRPARQSATPLLPLLTRPAWPNSVQRPHAWLAGATLNARKWNQFTSGRSAAFARSFTTH